MASINERHALRGRLAAVAIGIVGLETAAGAAAIGTFTLSTVPADRAAAGDSYVLLVTCGLVLLALSVLLWWSEVRLAAVLLGVAAVATVVGALTWILSLPLATVAVVLCLMESVGRPARSPRS